MKLTVPSAIMVIIGLMLISCLIAFCFAVFLPQRAKRPMKIPIDREAFAECTMEIYEYIEKEWNRSCQSRGLPPQCQNLPQETLDDIGLHIKEKLAKCFTEH